MNSTFPDWRGSISKEWHWVALRGLLAVFFAVIAFVAPIATAWALALFWGIFAFFDGLATISTGWRLHRQGIRWWPYLLFGIIGILAGMVAIIWPGITIVILVYVIGLWAIFGGVSEVFAALSIKREFDRWWIMLLSGILSVIFGLLIIASPFEGMLVMIWFLAGFTLLVGIFLLIFALRLKSAN